MSQRKAVWHAEIVRWSKRNSRGEWISKVFKNPRSFGFTAMITIPDSAYGRVVSVPVKDVEQAKAIIDELTSWVAAKEQEEIPNGA